MMSVSDIRQPESMEDNISSSVPRQMDSSSSVRKRIIATGDNQQDLGQDQQVWEYMVVEKKRIISLASSHSDV